MTDYSAAEKMLISSFGEFLRTVDEISHDRTVEVPLSKLLVAQTVIAATSDEVEELNEVLESSGIADSTSDILSPYLENLLLSWTESRMSSGCSTCGHPDPHRDPKGCWCGR
jgi:hypothetical protein